MKPPSVHAGEGIKAGYVKTKCYPAMLAENGWQARPWGGRHGVDKYLTRLMGGKRLTGYAEDANRNKKRARGYFVPRVLEVRKCVREAAS